MLLAYFLLFIPLYGFYVFLNQIHNNMKNYFKIIIVLIGFVTLIVVSCNEKNHNLEGNDSILEGKISVLVDESILPIVDDEKIVFENKYKATINLIPQSEKEAINSLLNNKANVIVLSRKLNQDENKKFSNKKIKPRTVPFATDAIVFVKNKKSSDTIIDLTDVISFLNGTKNGIKGLVFDNPNSSSVRFLCELAKIKELPENNVFSFKTNEEVINYVSKNDGLIGVVGINWLSQPRPEMQETVNSLQILSVKSADNQYVYPSQDNIAQNKYPLARELYIINCQGYEGLGMGFSSFIGGEIGQRIILKSGLVPVRFPSRQIVTRTQLEKK